MKKGFVNILELIFVLVALFIAFNVLFPGFAYRNKWDRAQLLLLNRDTIITMDRIGKLYEYSFDRSKLSDFLLNALHTDKTNLIGWSETDGTIKNRIIVACNCTEHQKDLLYSWVSGLKINGRPIDFYVVRTYLDDINPSDVLLIWGYKDLTPYRDQLIDYINRGHGVVEMMDFPVDPEPVQEEIFGITSGGSWGSPSADIVLKPDSASNITYQAYKIYINGLKGSDSITPEFCKDTPNKKIIQTPTAENRVLVRVDTGINPPASCVVLNDLKTAKVAWIANFTNINYNTNHTNLLISLLLFASNKRAVPVLSVPTSFGYMTSYINVKNDDMFEVYKFSLGLGHPY
ncbi:MAG: hypothetical protein ACTSV6_07255 [Candidatus Heimdallarchaeota archaeon]